MHEPFNRISEFQEALHGTLIESLLSLVEQASRGHQGEASRVPRLTQAQIWCQSKPVSQEEGGLNIKTMVALSLKAQDSIPPHMPLALFKLLFLCWCLM